MREIIGFIGMCVIVYFCFWLGQGACNYMNKNSPDQAFKAIGKQIEKAEQKPYAINIRCNNCNNKQELWVPWGTSIDNFLSHNPPCPKCGAPLTPSNRIIEPTTQPETTPTSWNEA